MGGGEKADIFLQIRSLVSDQLQVISYKWLSRNFSISSNNAKRLLKELVEKHGNDLEFIYTVSGWLKSDPQTYCVKLASAPRINDMKEEFQGTCSVQVYSVQACIPKETAVIWNPEFLQAEELFNQPPTQENCLRDNRFCGVSNSHVKRATDGKHVSSAPPKPIDGTSAFQKDLQSLKPPKQEPTGPTSSLNLEASENKPEKEKPTKPCPIIREPTKAKGQNGKSSSGNSGSLANMWGRASTKPKPAKETAEDVPSISATADEQICAREAADAIGSDDDFSDINYKRESNTRKRRVVFDFSDDENEDEEEKVTSLCSPPEPQEKPKLTVVKEEKNIEDQNGEGASSKSSNAGITLRVTRDATVSSKGKEIDTTTAGEEKILEDQNGEVANSKNSNAGITPRVKSDATVSSKGKEIDTTIAGASGSPKRRKVLKTRIDERGREVSEFVWEGEPASSDKPNQENAATDTNSRPTAIKAAALASSDDQNNVTSTKTSGGTGKSTSTAALNKPASNKKPAKAGTKDAKQGNILSFFKKI